jgi:hypothetical protein
LSALTLLAKLPSCTAHPWRACGGIESASPGAPASFGVSTGNLGDEGGLSSAGAEKSWARNVVTVGGALGA